MVANKYAFLQITRRRFLNEWEAFKKVISRRNIRRRITIPLTLAILNFLDESPERKTSFIEISRGGKLPYKTGSDRKSGSAGMPRPISYAVFCLKKKNHLQPACHSLSVHRSWPTQRLGRIATAAVLR